jgi:BirA family biotin operon repressor/biotin-[acetyl-CoA-carboxylase] ligase
VSAQLGLPRVHLRCTGSTNDRARELALRGAPHGTLVTAEAQSAGRGRQGRRWSAPPGSSLLMSIVLRWQVSDRSPSILPLVAAVAICDVVGPDARIKWPNDIVVDRAPALGKLAGIVVDRAPALGKLAGILVEGRPQQGWAVLGVGVNVAVHIKDLPATLRSGAATLAHGREAIEPFLDALLDALERRLAEPSEQTLQAWRVRDVLRDREIAWSGGRGRACGIDDDGRLLVELPDGLRTALAAGEVHLESAL